MWNPYQKGVDCPLCNNFNFSGWTAHCACKVGSPLADLISFAGAGLMILAIGNTMLLPEFEKITKIQKSVHKNKQTGTRKSAFWPYCRAFWCLSPQTFKNTWFLMSWRRNLSFLTILSYILLFQGGPQNRPKSAPGHPEAQNCIWWPSRHLEMVRNLMAEILEKFVGQAGAPKSSKT